MFSPRQIKEIIRKNNLCIHKKLGQNFLIDKNIRDKIIAACDIKKDEVVLEIGPGLGALTESLLLSCKRLIAVEKDKGLCGLLKDYLGGNRNLEVVNKDILDYDITPLFKKDKKKIKAIGNLPFYITSPVIFHLLKYKRYIDSAFITVQKEVAERMVSKPGGKDYGLLSCSLQYHCQPKILMRVSKACFFPRPEVEASFVELQIRKEPAVKVKDEELLFKLIKAAFNQRRKTLFNALCRSPILKADRESLRKSFARTGLDLKVRGEQLGLQEFSLLAEELFRDLP